MVRGEGVMKNVLLSVLVLVFVESSAFGSGLGDPVEGFKREYGNKIQVADNYSFGKPPRIGRLDGHAKGLFGASEAANPDPQQFFAGIRTLLPPDVKLLESYKKDAQWLKEIYIFKSAMLAGVPRIREAMAYQRYLSSYPAGTCFMIVNYDRDLKNRVDSFTVVLGLPERGDLIGMKKMTKNPFN